MTAKLQNCVHSIDINKLWQIMSIIINDNNRFYSKSIELPWEITTRMGHALFWKKCYRRYSIYFCLVANRYINWNFSVIKLFFMKLCSIIQHEVWKYNLFYIVKNVIPFHKWPSKIVKQKAGLWVWGTITFYM